MYRRALLLVLILLIATAVRFYDIGQRPLWLDELCSLEASSGHGLMEARLPVETPMPMPDMTSLAGVGPWWSIWTSMGMDAHPPLYFILLRGWREAFGDGEAALRSLSAMASVAAVLLVFDVVRVELPDCPAMALWAAALMALAPAQIRYAQEARGYSLLVALGAGALGVAARIHRRGMTPWRGVMLGFCTLAMLLTHYFAAGALAAMGIFALIYLRGAERNWTVGILAGACAVFAVIWGPFLVQQFRNAGIGTWQSEPAQGHVLRTLQRAAALPIRLFFEDPVQMDPTGSALWGAALAYVLPLPLLRGRPHLALFYIWTVLPLFLVIGWDLADGTILSEIIRYSIVASAGACALVACALNDRGPRLRHLLPGLAVIACLVQLPTFYSSRQATEGLLLTGVRPMARELERNVQAGDVVVISSLGADNWYAGALALGISHDARSLAAPVVLLTAPASPDFRQRLAKYRTIWLVIGSPLNASPSSFLGFGDGSPAQGYRYAGSLWRIVTESR